MSRYITCHQLTRGLLCILVGIYIYAIICFIFTVWSVGPTYPQTQKSSKIHEASTNVYIPINETALFNTSQTMQVHVFIFHIRVNGKLISNESLGNYKIN